jgi:CRISPR-associated protein Csx17
MEEEPCAEPPFGAWYRVALGDIEAWLSGAVDDAEVERWAMRFSLFAWDKDSVAAGSNRLGQSSPPDVHSGSLALFALFKPLFQRVLLSTLLPDGSKRHAAKVGPLPGIAAQLARGDITGAVRLARTAYRAAGIEPAKLHSEEFSCADPQRLLAALLIPAHGARLTELSLRWLSPQKNNNT